MDTVFLTELDSLNSFLNFFHISGYDTNDIHNFLFIHPVLVMLICLCVKLSIAYAAITKMRYLHTKDIINRVNESLNEQ